VYIVSSYLLVVFGREIFACNHQTCSISLFFSSIIIIWVWLWLWLWLRRNFLVAFAFFATDVLCSAHNYNNNNNNNYYYYYYYSHFLFVASSALCIFSRENLYCRRGWPLGTGWPPSGRTKNSLGHSINPLQKMLAVCAFRSFKRCVVSWPAVTGEFCPQNAYTFSSRFPVESNWQIQRHLEWVNVVRIPRIQRERKTVQGAQKSMPLSRIIIKSY